MEPVAPIDMQAQLLGLRIDTRGLEFPDTIALSPLTLRVGPGRMAFVFRYGVAVFVRLSPTEQLAILDQLRPRIIEPLAEPESDRIEPVVKLEGEDQIDTAGAIVLKDDSTERLQIVADVLSKSLVLAHHESKIASAFDRIDSLAMNIKRRGRGGRQARQLVREVGDILLTQHRMVGRVAPADKPDILWDRPELERSYARLADEYELVERGEAIDRKLTLVGDTVGTLLELVQDERSVRLEWYIIWLIAIEIVLSLYDLFFRSAHAAS